MSEEVALKLIVVGDSSVGKTSLMNRLVQGAFDTQRPTIGVGYGVKSLEVHGQRMKVQIWDTVTPTQAGQESFKAIALSYFRGAHGALVVYSVDNQSSFDHIPQWVEDIRGTARAGIPLGLVGNKKDLGQRKVPYYKAQRTAKSEGFCGVFECSARTGEGVEECFMSVIERAAGQVVAVNKGVDLSGSKRFQRKKKCCS